VFLNNTKTSGDFRDNVDYFRNGGHEGKH